MGVGNLVRCDQHRPHRRERVERLAGHPLLAGLVELPVASRDVVPDRIAADMLESPLAWDVPSAPADHHDKLCLVVNLLADGRQDNHLAVANQGCGVFAEEHRLFRHGNAALGGMIAIVEPDANDLPRVRHRRQEPHIRRIMPDGSAREGRPGLPLPLEPEIQKPAHRRGHLWIGRVDVDVLAAEHAASPWPLFGCNRDPAHRVLL